MKREEIAVSKRNKGYNCSQAVVCTYADVIGVNEKILFKMSEGMGSGLGCTLGTCGALNAASNVISMMTSTGNLENPNSKPITYPVMRKLLKDFEEKAGAVRCRDIKGIETGTVLCECEECVRIACRLIDAFIEKNAEIL